MLHAANPQLGQKNHGDNNDTNAPKPLQDAAPQQNTLGQVFELRKTPWTPLWSARTWPQRTHPPDALLLRLK